MTARADAGSRRMVGLPHPERRTAVSVATFADSETPLSGWHWVCPCGWTIHDHMSVPYQQVQAHRAWHQAEIARMRRRAPREGS